MLGRVYSVMLPAALVAAVLSAASASAQTPAAQPRGAQHASPQHGDSASQQMHHGMMSGMEGMRRMKPSGGTDQDFASMMKMHHQQAIEMARIEAERGKSPQMKALAEKIVEDSRRDITELDAFLQKRN